ncbi:hypothetical protein LZD49_34395 [Dyadobacter sp. CY261]|uniref:hypothetical protein n=1 Tax=Dyadobacter sp. CY261 TaxID=2907203 RepID=UPI001F4013F7|nr:hypothetical protein [Dyadobacter sp. CY261]MCF0075614.1 hypothetical protein [Dyadobacter sp. CY261]
MKTTLFLMLASLLFFNPSFGQHIKEGTVKSSNNEFDVKLSNKHLIVSNKKNGLVKTQNKLPDDVATSGLSNFLTYNQDEARRMLSIIKADFVKRGRPVPSERPGGIFYIGNDGKILEADFIVNEQTSLTIDDIDALESILKKQFRFKVIQGKLGSAKFAIWNTVLRLDEIASK